MCLYSSPAYRRAFSVKDDIMDIENRISSKVKSVRLSPIRSFFNMVSKVPGAISLTIGQPDFNTPENIKEAGVNAILNNHTTYTHNQGYIGLRKEISDYLERRYGLNYDCDTEILATIGSGQAIDASIRTLIEDGDEVLIPSPGYVAYSACVTLSGGTPVFVPMYMEDGFKLKADVLKKYITPRSKVLILSYPCNPTGATMDRYDLEEISKAVIENDLIIISDEIYSEMTYKKEHVSIASLEGMRERTVLINGLSKAYSMTGWRLGYAAAPCDIMKHMVKVHQYSVTCAPSISQYAGIEALAHGDEGVKSMVKEYDRRRLYCYERIIDMGLPCLEPAGAFYIFPDISKFGLSSEEFCKRLLFEGMLAAVPGSAFGTFGEGHIRISYAYSMETLEEGLNRLEAFVNSLK